MARKANGPIGNKILRRMSYEQWQGVRTVGQLCNRKLPGMYIVSVRGHVFAMRDGVIMDRYPQGARKLIRSLWHFVAANPTGEVDNGA